MGNGTTLMRNNSGISRHADSLAFWCNSLAYWLTREGVYGPNVLCAVEMHDYHHARIVLLAQKGSNS